MKRSIASLAAVLIACACPGEMSGAIVIGLDPESAAPANTLSVSLVDDGTPPALMFESIGVVLGDRVELLYSSELVFGEVTTPDDWRVQVSVVTREGVQRGLATYLYVGADESSDVEFFTLLEGWSAEFLLVDERLTGDDGPGVLATLVGADVFATVLIPGLGPVAVHQSIDFEAGMVAMVPEPGRLVLSCLGLVAALRRRRPGRVNASRR